MNKSGRIQYERVLRQATRNLALDDSAGREIAYQKMRRANERLILNKGETLPPGLADRMRLTLEEVISSDRKFANGVASAPPSRNQLGFLTIGIAGFLLGVLCTSVWGALRTVKPPHGSVAVIERLFTQRLSQVEPAANFLSRVQDAVLERQRKDPSGLTALAGETYVPLSSFDAELAKEMPAELAPSSILLRANAQSYKILFDWPLCATVQIFRPELVEPVRRTNALGCPYFGVWTDDVELTW